MQLPQVPPITTEQATGALRALGVDLDPMDVRSFRVDGQGLELEVLAKDDAGLPAGPFGDEPTTHTIRVPWKREYGVRRRG